MNKHLQIALISIFSLSFAFGQQATEIYKKLEKFNFLGSVLYVAAHPDDENTRMISYFSNHANARTAYLSITRGDGGQNLIGSELREGLGVIRTEELLAARRIDGGEQFFTTANDFGYSKHPDETLKVWDKKEVLSQMVQRIREFRPDIIINRFNHRTPGSTHGHHTSSAMLSVEAFEKAGKADASTTPEATAPWQPKRFFFNTSWWFYGSRENFRKADKSNLIALETGLYDPLTGLFNSQIAASSRSQHKSQGFGSAPSLGQQQEYLELIKGKLPSNNNPFEGIDTSWNRVKRGKKIGVLVEKVIADFDFTRPAASIPQLLKIYDYVQKLKDPHWKNIKTKELEGIIVDCLGLVLQANASEAVGTPGSNVKVNLRAVQPESFPVQLHSVAIENQTLEVNTPLKNNHLFQENVNITLPETINSPYWLLQNGSKGMYAVKDPKLKGLPQSPTPIKTTFELSIQETTFQISVPLVYRTTEPVAGEVVQPFQILPEATVNFSQPIHLFTSSKAKKVEVNVQVHKANFKGRLQLSLPRGWVINPQFHEVALERKGASKTFSFKITPPVKSGSTSLRAVVRTDDGKVYKHALQEIDYAHIPKQYVLMPNKTKLEKIDLQSRVKKIAYIRGAGDKIPESLLAVGIDVTEMEADEITLGQLQQFPTVVVGIRAFNVAEALQLKNEVLWEYAAQGGTLVLQYNTSRGLKTKDLTPFSLQLSRDRVTDEQSKVNFLSPSHPLLSNPNAITQNDFEKWVQERGLYFPNQWSGEFTPLLEMNDPGETPKKGSLLVADYGEGKIIYTGLSFFRQLPAGVSGAYRLFFNLISYGHEADSR